LQAQQGDYDGRGKREPFSASRETPAVEAQEFLAVGTRGEVQRVREIQPVVMPVQRGFDLFPTSHDDVRQPQQVPDDANEIHRLETVEGAQYPLEST
jgi:hypothetical protein